MRLFVAVELPGEVQERIAGIGDALRGGLPAARWTPVGNLHLTLAFLGETEERRLADLERALAPVFGSAAGIELRIGGCGTFPPQRRARVAWVGVDGGEMLLELARRTGLALEAALGRPLERRPFHPHVTVARPRRPWPRSAAAEFTRAFSGVSGAWDLDRAVLMESSMGPGGSRYTVRQEYPLVATAAAAPPPPGEPRDE